MNRDAHEDTETTKREPNVEELTAIVVDAAFHIHKELGPGLLESVYEAVLARALGKRGLRVERQKTVVNGPQSFASSRLRVNRDLRP